MLGKLAGEANRMLPRSVPHPDPVGVAQAEPTATDQAAQPAASVAPVPVAHFERRAMGSPLRLTLVGIEPDRARSAWEATSRLIETIEQALSRFRESSDLMALNARAGDPLARPVAPFLHSAIAAAHRAWRVTDGAFDPRILRDLERLGYVGAELPKGGALVPVPGSFPPGDWLVRSPQDRRVAISRPLDLGGIGKGLALRWTLAALARLLPEIDQPKPAGEEFDASARTAPVFGAGALLEAGGDIIARGAAPDPGPWLIGIEHPLTEREVAIVAVEAGAICTSSIAVHRWSNSDGRVVHHLVDPRTGEPGGEGLLSVTVAGPDPAWAEVRSKTLFLSGGRGIGAKARTLGLAAWWVRDTGEMEMTPGARMQTAWLASDDAR